MFGNGKRQALRGIFRTNDGSGAANSIIIIRSEA
jgi:hypothetical protein